MSVKMTKEQVVELFEIAVKEMADYVLGRATHVTTVDLYLSKEAYAAMRLWTEKIDYMIMAPRPVVDAVQKFKFCGITLNAHRVVDGQLQDFCVCHIDGPDDAYTLPFNFNPENS